MIDIIEIACARMNCVLTGVDFLWLLLFGVERLIVFVRKSATTVKSFNDFHGSGLMSSKKSANNTVANSMDLTGCECACMCA